MKQTILLLLIICVSVLNSFAQKQDSLYAKRVFITTYLYKDGVKLNNSKINQLFKDTEQPKIKYKWSNILKPIGPVVTLGGFGLAYVAIKGTPATAIVSGKEVGYKIRSLPKLLAGLGLIAGGLSMIESSNELAQHAVDIYNSKLHETQNTSYIDKVQFGITDSNGLGFSILLK